jgi:hypothetical protein
VLSEWAKKRTAKSGLINHAIKPEFCPFVWTTDSNSHFGFKACETPRHSGMDAGMTVVLAKMRIA